MDPDSRQIANAMKRVKAINAGADTDAIRKYADYRTLFAEMGESWTR